MEHSKVNIAAGPLVVMRSIDQGPNAQVAVDQPIPIFPATADGVSQLTGTLPFPRLLFFRLAELTNVLRSGSMSRNPYSPQ